MYILSPCDTCSPQNDPISPEDSFALDSLGVCGGLRLGELVIHWILMSTGRLVYEINNILKISHPKGGHYLNI